MSTDDWGVFLITMAAIPSTLALLDLALYIHWTHWIPPDRLVLAIYAVIAVGAWMWLGAVIHEQFWKRYQRRQP